MRSLILALLVTMLLVSCGNEVPVMAKPAGTEWLVIAHDPLITIKQSEATGLPLVDYEVGTSTITVWKHFGAAIAWQDQSFVHIVAYSPLSSGAMLVRIDKAAKVVVYAVSLCGIGGIDHSQYHNEVRVFINRDLVKIVGEESGGRYEEIRRLADGSLVHVSQSFSAFKQPKFVNVH